MPCRSAVQQATRRQHLRCVPPQPGKDGAHPAEGDEPSRVVRVHQSQQVLWQGGQAGGAGTAHSQAGRLAAQPHWMHALLRVRCGSSKTMAKLLLISPGCTCRCAHPPPQRRQSPGSPCRHAGTAAWLGMVRSQVACRLPNWRRDRSDTAHSAGGGSKKAQPGEAPLVSHLLAAQVVGLEPAELAGSVSAWWPGGPAAGRRAWRGEAPVGCAGCMATM